MTRQRSAFLISTLKKKKHAGSIVSSSCAFAEHELSIFILQWSSLLKLAHYLTESYKEFASKKLKERESRFLKCPAW